MENLKKKILKNNPDLKESSINTYLNSIKKLSHYLGISKFNVKYLNDFDSVINFLENESNFSLPTKRNYITAILVVIKLDKKINPNISKAYYTYHKNLTEIQNDIYSENIKTEKEETNWITLEEIITKKEKIESIIHNLLKDNTFNINLLDKFQQYIILNLYTLLPPIRNDYAGEMLLLKEDLEQYSKLNRIILSQKHLILTNYKTSGSYGTKVIDIPEKLNVILKDWFSLRTIYNNINLVNNNKKQADKFYLLIKLTNPNEFMSKNMLTKTLNKIFYPKKVSTTLLRKIYLSEKYPVISTYKEMQNDAYIMGHDINTAKLIYSKK